MIWLSLTIKSPFGEDCKKLLRVIYLLNMYCASRVKLWWDRKLSERVESSCACLPVCSLAWVSPAVLLLWQPYWKYTEIAAKLPGSLLLYRVLLSVLKEEKPTCNLVRFNTRRRECDACFNLYLFIDVWKNWTGKFTLNNEQCLDLPRCCVSLCCCSTLMSK